MSLVITIIHILACVSIIFVVLLQSGKGASMGAAFGGSSQTVFGSSGAGTFLGKLTTGIAIVFMLTSLGLTIFSGSGSSSKSIMNELSPPVQTQPAEQGAPLSETAPAAPETE
jgi:preprotein translocase subunit SecG